MSQHVSPLKSSVYSTYKTPVRIYTDQHTRAVFIPNIKRPCMSLHVSEMRSSIYTTYIKPVYASKRISTEGEYLYHI